jgi:hypothetical protein
MKKVIQVQRASKLPLKFQNLTAQEQLSFLAGNGCPTLGANDVWIVGVQVVTTFDPSTRLAKP